MASPARRYGVRPLARPRPASYRLTIDCREPRPRGDGTSRPTCCDSSLIRSLEVGTVWKRIENACDPLLGNRTLAYLTRKVMLDYDRRDELKTACSRLRAWSPATVCG